MQPSDVELPNTLGEKKNAQRILNTQSLSQHIFLTALQNGFTLLSAYLLHAQYDSKTPLNSQKWLHILFLQK